MYIDLKKKNFFSFTVKPLRVDILTKEPRFIADKKYAVECRTHGSRPDALITWWIGNKQIFNKTRLVSLLFLIL